MLQSRTDEFVIATFLSVGSVTPYALGRRLSEIPQIVGDQALKILLPISWDLEAGREIARVKAAFIAGTRIALVLVAPIGLVIGLLADAILVAWVGPAYGNPGPVVAILVTAVILDATLWPSAYVLQGVTRHRPLAVIAVASGVVNVAGVQVLLVGAPRRDRRGHRNACRPWPGRRAHNPVCDASPRRDVGRPRGPDRLTRIGPSRAGRRGDRRCTNAAA